MSKPARATATPVFDRAPPFDPEAEINVLGSIMLLPEVCDDVVLIARPDDFHDDANRKIFRHMLEMHNAGRKIDPTLLVDKLKTAGDFESTGGAAYLGKILHAVPNASHAVYYAEIVASLAALRRLIEVCTETLRQAYDRSADASEILAYAQGAIAALSADRSSAQARSIGDVAAETIREIEAAVNSDRKMGIHWGVGAIDVAAGPMLPGELIVIGARTGDGKSALAGQITEKCDKRKQHPLYVSLEMSDKEIVCRRLCRETGLDSRDVRNGCLSPEQLSAMKVAASELQDQPQYMWSPARASLADIRNVARYRKRHDKVDLLVVDYLGLIQPTAEERRLPRYELIGSFTRELKSLAKELQVPVIVLSQLNRAAENEEPTLGHLRESGAIEQDADTVVLIHHPARRANKAPNTGEERDAYAIIAKHRHSEVGRVALRWVPKQTAFYSPEEF